MKEEVQRLLDGYLSWVRGKTTLREIEGDWVEITTPFLDRHNDALQIFAQRRNGGYLLTDDGFIIEELVQNGCKLDSPKRQALLKMTLAGFGVQNREGKLEVQSSPENFGIKKHNLIQAMLAVNDLFYLAIPMVASLFYEDVVAWLDSCDIRYTPGVKFTGKSGYDHMFDFVVPKSRSHPERILHTINHANRDTAEALAFRWIDTKEVRSAGSRAYAILNDQEHRVQPAVIEALESYDVKPVLWSARGNIVQELAA